MRYTHRHFTLLYVYATAINNEQLTLSYYAEGERERERERDL